MKKRLLSALCAVMLLVCVVPMASAQSGDDTRMADALTVLHILAEEPDRDLTAPATRAQAAVLLVRWASYRALKGRLLAGAVPAGEDTRCLLGHLTRDRRRPAILCAPQVPAPMLMGVVRPVILIPPQAEGQAGLEDMLAHELVHWRRKDLWVKWAAALAAAVHWFNPAAWWLIARLDRACELACDEAVVRAWPPQRRARYGTLILALASGEGCSLPERGS